MTDLGKVLILGSGGQLGTELRRSFGDCPGMEAYGRERVDLTNEESLRQIVRQVRPNIILNAAAYTAVDRAESEPELAMAINGIAPGILAEEAAKLDALFVHYSTDYVFDGAKTEPWVETDEPAPLNVYGHTKLAGEQAVAHCGGKYLILRTSWVYGPHGHNFLLTMLRLAQEREHVSVVDDQYGSPTTSIELADTTRTLVSRILEEPFSTSTEWVGVYHMTCSGSTSWCGFAREIFSLVGQKFSSRIPTVRPITSDEYPTPARRPRNSVLSNQKLSKGFDIQLAPWTTALENSIECLTASKQMV
jgi:dTDP-4-dehydrorhamnose reductase